MIKKEYILKLKNTRRMEIVRILNRAAGNNAILNIDFSPGSSDRAVQCCSTSGMGRESIDVMIENH